MPKYTTFLERLVLVILLLLVIISTQHAEGSCSLSPSYVYVNLPTSYTYLYDETTQRTTLTFTDVPDGVCPTSGVLVEPTPLPDGWEVAVDPKSGKVIYYNLGFYRSQGDRPPLQTPAVAVVPALTKVAKKGKGGRRLPSLS